jgi:DNA-binding winged helix-turn-helix (wHTH) protein
MSNPVESASRVSFGLYEADLQTGELWKAGRRIKIQSQPFKVLSALLERPGEVVTREELQLRLWGKDTIVDFDHSLGTAINKIREALSDSAENPLFVETLARRGYRFIAPVTFPPPPAATTVALPPDSTALSAVLQSPPGSITIEKSEVSSGNDPVAAIIPADLPSLRRTLTFASIATRASLPE